MGLVRLTINDVVLIDHLEIAFSDGLGVLTGETGAGKSILLGALGLALGVRADSGLVRKGAEKARVLAEFSLAPDHAVFSYGADTLDLDLDRGEPLLLRRSVTADGRSRCFVNDQPVSVKSLQALGGLLVEIHGQFDTHGLMNSAQHRGILDEFAGAQGALAGAYAAYKQAGDHYRDLQEKLELIRAEEEYLRQSIADLDALEPIAGEEEILQQKRDSLMNREQILQALDQSYAALSSDDNPLYKVSGLLDRLSGKMEASQGEAIIGALDRASSELEEARSLIQSYSSDLMDDDMGLESVDDRLYALRGQARKHGCSVDALAERREALARDLNAIESGEDDLLQARKAYDQAFDVYKAQAQALHEKRVEAAAQLDGLITAQLEPLKLGRAVFKTQIDILPEDQWGAGGMDAVQFLVSTNAGHDPAPLSKVASGGELARFMLALKSVLADTGTAETLLFDEVDAGVGGATAAAVAERLAGLADKRQVLVVTHAPQIAARAKAHYVVQKAEEGGMVTSDIRLLGAEERAEEVARMLAGAEVTAEARAAAKKLMGVAA